ncbi:MAG: hypothetical protein IPN94_07970 [Sphingobacteriales bacterium]|nr:hypothetical protein [Sphingobacteriales bacterium]
MPKPDPTPSRRTPTPDVLGNKVWTNANCSDPGGQEYVYRGIRVRPHDDITGVGWSTSGLNLRADGNENRWWSRTEWAGLQTPPGTANFPMTQDANGVLMMDITYPIHGCSNCF